MIDLPDRSRPDLALVPALRSRTRLDTRLERITILVRRGQLVVQHSSETLVLGVFLGVLEMPQLPGRSSRLFLFAALAQVVQ